MQTYKGYKVLYSRSMRVILFIPFYGCRSGSYRNFSECVSDYQPESESMNLTQNVGPLVATSGLKRQHTAGAHEPKYFRVISVERTVLDAHCSHACVLSCVRPFANPMNCSPHAPLSAGLPGQEY